MAKVVVYAAGGAAVNICKELYRPHDDVLKDDGFAELQVVFVDTSRSNFPKDLPESAYYLVQGMGDVTIESIEPGNRITVKSASGDFFMAEVVRDYHGPKFQNATLKSLVSPELRYKGRKALDRYPRGGVFEEVRR